MTVTFLEMLSVTPGKNSTQHNHQQTHTSHSSFSTSSFNQHLITNNHDTKETPEE